MKKKIFSTLILVVIMMGTAHYVLHMSKPIDNIVNPATPAPPGTTTSCQWEGSYMVCRHIVDAKPAADTTAPYSVVAAPVSPDPTVAPIPVNTSDDDDGPPCDYEVQEGDNLTDIAQQQDVRIDQILENNKTIKNPNLINVGQKLYIPEEIDAADWSNFPRIFGVEPFVPIYVFIENNKVFVHGIPARWGDTGVYQYHVERSEYQLDRYQVCNKETKCKIVASGIAYGGWGQERVIDKTPYENSLYHYRVTAIYSDRRGWGSKAHYAVSDSVSTFVPMDVERKKCK